MNKNEKRISKILLSLLLSAPLPLFSFETPQDIRSIPKVPPICADLIKAVPAGIYVFRRDAGTNLSSELEPTSNSLALQSGRDRIRLVDLKTGSELNSFEIENPEAVPLQLKFSTGGALLATSDSKVIRMLNSLTGELVQRFEVPPSKDLIADWIAEFRINTPRYLLIAARLKAFGGHSTFMKWYLNSGKLLDSYDLFDEPMKLTPEISSAGSNRIIRKVQISAEGDLAVTYSYVQGRTFRTIEGWDLVAKKKIFEFANPENDPFQGFHLSADGTRVIILYSKGRTVVVHSRSGKIIGERIDPWGERKYPFWNNNPQFPSQAPDQMLPFIGQGSIGVIHSLVDLASGRIIQPIYEFPPMALKFSPSADFMVQDFNAGPTKIFEFVPEATAP